MNKFTFAKAVEGFDNHISQSIPGYSELTDMVVELSRSFIRQGSASVDLGCSTGKLVERIAKANSKVGFYPEGVEIEEDFLPEMQKTMRRCEEYDVRLLHDDISNYTFCDHDYVTSLFTLQFMPEFDRAKTIQEIYDGLAKGGAFVFAEKLYSDDSRVQDILTFLYYDFKRKTYTPDEILDKEYELRSMMKLKKESELMEEMKQVGFNPIPFWRNLNFAAYICVK